MSEYWWSWKLHRVPFSTSLQWRMGCVWGGGAGRAYTGFPWRGAALNIQNPGVLCRVSKGDQSHFEALGASFVCERCEVLPKWLRQFFKTHLQLTPGGSALSVVVVVFLKGGSSLQTHDWIRPTYWMHAQGKNIGALESYICKSDLWQKIWTELERSKESKDVLAWKDKSAKTRKNEKSRSFSAMLFFGLYFYKISDRNNLDNCFEAWGYFKRHFAAICPLHLICGALGSAKIIISIFCQCAIIPNPECFGFF